MSKDPTLQFYAQNAAEYAAANKAGTNPELEAFLSRLSPGGRILELGTGGGRHATTMLDRGFDVIATDGSAELAAEAEKLLRRPVKVMLFAELDEDAAYDGVWASASLLHAPAEALDGILRRVHRALVPGGHFVASYKAGDGPGHDSFGRYYNYPSRAALESHYRNAANWAELSIIESAGSGYDREPTQWLWARVTK